MSTPGESLGQVALPSTCLHRLDAQSVPHQSYELRIWLPPSYSESPARDYPVLYMPDGDYCFGMAVDVVRYLTRGKLIPEIVIAAVGYGSDRPPEEGGRNMRSLDLAPFVMEIAPEPRGEAFRLFLQQELIPFVESTYRSDADLRAFYGFSLGGLFGLYEMFTSPRLFSRYILVSPALAPSTAQIISQAETFVASEAKPPANVYMCIGDLEVSVPWFTRLADALDKRRQAEFRFEWEVFPRGVHMTAPAEALAKGLKMAFGARSICEAMYSLYKQGGIDSAKALYRDLNARRAPEYSFAEDELNNLGYLLLYRDRVKDAVEVFELNVAAYPEAWNVYDSLGEAQLAAGNASLARSNYEKSVELNPKNEFGIAQLQKLKTTEEKQSMS